MNKEEVQGVIDSLENLAEQDCSQMNYDLRKALMGYLIKGLSNSDESVWSAKYPDSDGHDLLTYLFEYNYRMHVKILPPKSEKTSAKPKGAYRTYFASFDLGCYIEQYIKIRELCSGERAPSAMETARESEKAEIKGIGDKLEVKMQQEINYVHYEGTAGGARCTFTFEKTEFGNYKIPFMHPCMRAMHLLHAYHRNGELMASLAKIQAYVDKAQEIADTNLVKIVPQSKHRMDLREARSEAKHFVASPGNGEASPKDETCRQRSDRSQELGRRLSALQTNYVKANKRIKIATEKEEDKENEAVKGLLMLSPR